MTIFRVLAVDEFDRQFGAAEAVTTIGIDTADFSLRDWIFESLVSDILRLMGEAAHADWTGSTEIIDWT